MRLSRSLAAMTAALGIIMGGWWGPATLAAQGQGQAGTQIYYGTTGTAELLGTHASSSSSGVSPDSTVSGSCGSASISSYSAGRILYANWRAISTCGDIVGYGFYVNYYATGTPGTYFKTIPQVGQSILDPEVTGQVEYPIPTSKGAGTFCVNLTGTAVTDNGTIEYSEVPQSCSYVAS